MNSAGMNVYWRSPLWIQNMLSSIKGYQLRRLRYGGIFKEELERLEKSQWMSASDFANLQTDMLRQTIQHAYENVPYYRELLDTLSLKSSDFVSLADLQKLPILTKATVRQNLGRFISKQAPLMSIIYYRTSGSTGTAMPLACNAEAIQKDWAVMWRANRRFGVDFTARGAHFPGKIIVPPSQQSPPFWRSNTFANQKIFSVFHISNSNVAHYIDELDRWAPDYWYGYASAMSLLCKHAKRIGRLCNPPPKAIFAGSEKVYPTDREVMMEVGRCKVMSGYGSQEYVCRIMECEAGSFHIDSEYGTVEIVGDDGEPSTTGRLVATGFANKVMPLIRYYTGDLAKWAEGQCTCGRESPRVAEIIGRMEDSILTPDGRTIGHGILVHLVSLNVIESQLYQPDRHTIVMRIVKDRRYTSDDEKLIERALRAKLGTSMDILFHYMDVLPRTSAGKVRAIVSDVNQNKF